MAEVEVELPPQPQPQAGPSEKAIAGLNLFLQESWLREDNGALGPPLEVLGASGSPDLEVRCCGADGSVANWQIHADCNSIFLRVGGEAGAVGLKLNPLESRKGKVVWGEGSEPRQIWRAASGERPAAPASAAAPSSDGLDAVAAAELCPAADPEPAAAVAGSEPREIWHGLSGERPAVSASAAASSSDGLDVAAAELCPAAEPEPAAAVEGSEPQPVWHAASGERPAAPASAAAPSSSDAEAAAADAEPCPAAEPEPAAAAAPVSAGEPEPGAARADAVHAVAAVQRLLDLGTLAWNDMQYEDAKGLLSKAVEAAYALFAPTALLVVAVRRRAEASVLLKDWSGALADASYCLQVEPDNCKSYEVLGLLKLATGCFKEARVAYKRAVELAPADLQPAAEQSLFRAEKLLLYSQRVPNCDRTFMAEDWSLGGIWRFCQGCPVSPEAPTPRNFAMVFRSTRQASKPTLPYVLTVPTNLLGTGTEDTLGAKYPLVVYMHSAASTDICKGNILERQLQFVAQEAPLSVFAERGVGDPRAGDSCMGHCIGLAPCCPPNMGSLFEDLPKNERKRKIFWFKACESHSYFSWDFSKATRVKEVECLVVELLEHVLSTLPVDVSRVSFVGSSCGGYAVFRLAELVPKLPAAVVSLAGYYPVGMEDQDHDVPTLVRRLKDVEFIWPLHCDMDKLCRLESPHVANLYRELDERRGVKVEWVSHSVAQGSQKNYHSSYNYIMDNPTRFFNMLLALTNTKVSDMAPYMSKRLTELMAPDLPPPPLLPPQQLLPPLLPGAPSGASLDEGEGESPAPAG